MEQKGGEEKEEDGTMCCPISNKLSPPMVEMWQTFYLYSEKNS